MKKRVSILLTALLTAVLVLTSCSSSVDVKGTYTSVFDMTDMIGLQGQDISEPVTMNFQLVLSDGGSFVLSVDTDSLISSVKKLYSEDFVRQSLVAEGIAEDEIDPIIESMGYANIQEFIDGLVADMMSDDYLKEIYDNVYTEGTYSVSGNKVTMESRRADGTETADEATINEDGSLSVVLSTEEFDKELVFVKDAA